MLDELHEWFLRFPVKGSGDVVGTLYFKDAVNMDTSHSVKNIMRKMFLCEQSALLDQALKAFLRRSIICLWLLTNTRCRWRDFYRRYIGANNWQEDC